MTYRILFILLAVFAVAALPDQASAQCMECKDCSYGHGRGCAGAQEGGSANCGQDGFEGENEDGRPGFVCMCQEYGASCEAAAADGTVEEHLPMAIAKSHGWQLHAGGRTVVLRGRRTRYRLPPKVQRGARAPCRRSGIRS